jgi:hypothetical protein
MQTEGRYYSDIEELEIVLTAEEANQKLASGYELLKIETISTVQRLGDLTAQETRRLAFVLGRKKETTTTVSKQAPEGQESVKETIIPIYIPWKEQTSGFAWAFATNKDGSAIEEYKAFIERLKLSPLERDGYRYSISKDGKFLQRTKVKGSD